jgi:hypothetical protein
MSKLLFDEFKPVIEEESEETVVLSDTTSSAIPTKPKNILMEEFSPENTEEPEAVTTRNRETIENNTAVRGAAQRFVRDRLGITDMSDEEAMEEFVEHFRKFNVNEMTAAGDFNYVSGIAADATGKTNLDTKRRDEAKQRLSDYQLLYTTFQDLPSFHGGGWETFFDYAEGIMKAPSTYIGLALPGAGKAGGIAANTAAKAATQSVLMTALKTVAPSNVIKQAAARPLPTALAVEGLAAATQNIAAQKTEIAANLRDEFSLGEGAAMIGASALPAAVGVYGLKGLVRKGVERNTGDLLGDAQKAIIEKNEAAEAAADKILKENDIIAKDLKSVLAGLDPENKIKTKKKKKEKPVDKRALPEEQVETGQEQFGEIGDTMGVTPEFALSFDPSRNKRIFGAVTELIKKGKINIDIKNDPNKRVTEYVSDAIRQFAKDDPDKAAKLFEDLAEKYNLTGDDFANLFIADISDAARKLQGASAASRIFKRLNGVAGDDIFYLDTQTKELIQKATDDITKGDNRAAFQFLTEAERRASKKSGKSLMDHLQRLDELRRSAMTSQVATTIRNTASGAARVGIDVVTKGFDRGLAKFVHGATGGKFGSKAGGLAAPNEDVFAILMGLMNKKETDAVETLFKEGFTKKSAQLFREMQDVLDSAIPDSARTSKLRIIGKELNALNTASDNLFKRAAFVGNLKRGLNELAAKGEKVGKLQATDLNLSNIIRQGNFNAVFNTPQGKKILDKAIDESLYFTYQRTPDNPTARQMIKLAHSAPFLTSSLVPFPRFIANALRFTYEYSPLYVMSDLWGKGAISKTFRDGGAENFEEISKALVGTAGLYGAMAFRESEYAGEKWYEARLPDGTTFDMRPFFPAAPYLWVADLVNRYEKAKDDPKADPVIGESSFFTEGLQALSGTQFRAGFGIYAIDGAIEDWLGAKDNPEALQKIGINMAANVASTYSIPLTVGQDLYNTFLSPDDERIVRDTKSSSLGSLFINKALARVPGNYAIEKMLAESIGTTAPEIYESPTRAGVLRRTTPLTRQYMGILKQERKNWFEKEIDTLKIGRRIIARKTGIPEADILLNQHFGEYIEDYVTPTLKNSEEYADMTAAEKRNMMVNVIGHYKQDIEDLVKRKARASDDAMLSRFGFNPIKAADFKNLPKFARENALRRYHELHGVPDDTTKGYNYDELIYYGKFYVEQGKESKQ